MTREKYVAPTMRAHGTVETITQGGSGGVRLDQSFDIGTPVTDLTAS
ncbi:MAG: lasso RiPP family leader peptide-containing protein [Pseudomonadota bacterium]